jgi:hypothetical protein
VPAGDALQAVAFLDADEEVVRAQGFVGDEAQRDRRGFGRTAALAAWLGLGGGGECGIELAGGRLVAHALAVALGGVGDLEGDGTADVVVVPQQSSCDHTGPAVSIQEWPACESSTRLQRRIPPSRLAARGRNAASRGTTLRARQCMVKA